jgi:hypothetical protein
MAVPQVSEAELVEAFIGQADRCTHSGLRLRDCFSRTVFDLVFRYGSVLQKSAVRQALIACISRASIARCRQRAGALRCRTHTSTRSSGPGLRGPRLAGREFDKCVRDEVRFGSLADIAAAFPDVRFTPESGHRTLVHALNGNGQA